MCARDGLELPVTLELALKRTIIIAEVAPPDDLDRAEFAEGVSRQPDFAIRTLPNQA